MLPYALLLSLLAHFVILPLLFWSIAVQLPKEITPPEERVTSTMVTISSRTIPKPMQPAAQSNAPVTPQRQQETQPDQPIRQTPVPETPAPRHELSHDSPTAPPQAPQRPNVQPTSAQKTLQQQLNEQQQQYARVAARLSQENRTVSIATIAPSTPSARYVNDFNESGTRDAFRGGNGLLFPERSWHPDPAHTCYYASYSFRYNSGASEEGVVPWPLCYPINNDEFKKPPHPMELETPAPGFTTDRFLTPLLKYYYNHKQGTPP